MYIIITINKKPKVAETVDVANPDQIRGVKTALWFWKKYEKK